MGQSVITDSPSRGKSRTNSSPSLDPVGEGRPAVFDLWYMRTAFSFLQNEEGRGNGFVAFDEARTHYYWLLLLYNLMTMVIPQPRLRKCWHLALNQSHAPGEQRLGPGIPGTG